MSSTLGMKKTYFQTQPHTIQVAPNHIPLDVRYLQRLKISIKTFHYLNPQFQPLTQHKKNTAFILWRLEKMGPWFPGGALPGARWQVDTWRSRYWTVFELTRPVPHSPPPSGIFPGGGAAGGEDQRRKPRDFSWEFGSQF